jgi:putative transposase
LGVMDRLVLSDAAWERMAPLIIGRPDQKGSTGRDNRMFVEGVLWIVRTGSPWRDLPETFGDWNSVFRRFSRWSIKGVWYRMFEAMSDDPEAHGRAPAERACQGALDVVYRFPTFPSEDCGGLLG